MDDADIEKLVINPGKLAPAFKKDCTSYDVTLASNVKELKLQIDTSDTGASYSILNSSDGGRSVALKEGETIPIKIEVTAEDGRTVKIYVINARRLSAKDATLSQITSSVGEIQPQFEPSLLNYQCDVSSDTQEVVLKPEASDTAIKLLVNAADPTQPVKLNIGSSHVEINVTSVDGSTQQVYVVNFIRQPINQAVLFTDPSTSAQYQCPFCLNYIYCPLTIVGSEPKHTFCSCCIDELTRTSKLDPLDESPLITEWKAEDSELDKRLSNVTVPCVYKFNGCTENCNLTALSGHIKQCQHKPNTDYNSKDLNETCTDCGRSVLKVDQPAHKNNLCTSKHTADTVKHTVEVRKWEKKLQQASSERNITVLQKEADQMISKYRTSLPKKGQAVRYEDDSSPIDFLSNAATLITNAIKVNGKEASLHHRLGQILEEQYYAEDMYNLKPTEEDDFMSLNMSAKESSKDDDVNALCGRYGVSNSAPLAEKLKAIDAEYKHLIQSGQSEKSDYVQNLYAWKSKQATQEGKVAQLAGDEETTLGQAYLKYMDALSLDQNNAVYNLDVGRLSLFQGNAEVAIPRLQLALGTKPSLIPAKFYLGMALGQTGNKARVNEAVSYLQQSLNLVLTQGTEQSFDLHIEDHWRHDNILLLKGFHLLSTLLTDVIENTMTPEQILHNVALLCARKLQNLVHRGEVYRQCQWILLNTHSNLLQLLSKKHPGNKDMIVNRSANLSAFIKTSAIPLSDDIINLQEKICETTVWIQPCNSKGLSLLGNSQLAKYDYNPSSDDAQLTLDEAVDSFRSSIGLEGKGSGSSGPEEKLASQRWWKAKLESEKKAQEAKAAPAAASKAPAAAPARGKAPAARGPAAAKPAPARGAPAARGARGAPARGAAAPARGVTPAPGRGAARGAPGQSSTKRCCLTQESLAQPVKATTNTASTAETANAVTAGSSDSGPVNRTAYHPRLGLARALVRKNPDHLDEVKSLYSEVMTMAPELHDSYIELADLVVKADPMAAVEIYNKFPACENPNFDDAYIFGEIVRLIMKQEKFDDPRLGPNMISWGRVMGIGSLEKYVNILDAKFKSKLLMDVYAGVNCKPVDDDTMQAFFKYKCWI